MGAEGDDGVEEETFEEPRDCESEISVGMDSKVTQPCNIQASDLDYFQHRSHKGQSEPLRINQIDDDEFYQYDENDKNLNFNDEKIFVLHELSKDSYSFPKSPKICTVSKDIQSILILILWPAVCP